MEFGNKEDLAKSLIKQKWYCIEFHDKADDEWDEDDLAYEYVVYKWNWSDIEEEYFDYDEYDQIEKELIKSWYKDSQELINKFQWYWLNIKFIPYLLR